MKWEFVECEDSKERDEQLRYDYDWFRDNVKCCSNCKHYIVDYSLKNRYMFDWCDILGGNSRWDVICEKYETRGFNSEMQENLFGRVKIVEE